MQLNRKHYIPNPTDLLQRCCLSRKGDQIPFDEAISWINNNRHLNLSLSLYKLTRRVNICLGMGNKLLTRCLLTQDFSCGCKTNMSTESRCLDSLCLCHSLDNHYQNLSSWVIFVTINQEATRKGRPCPPPFPGKSFSTQLKINVWDAIARSYVFLLHSKVSPQPFCACAGPSDHCVREICLEICQSLILNQNATAEEEEMWGQQFSI